MKLIAYIVFIIAQIVFIPLAFIGLILITVNQLFVSKWLGVSSTAISVIGNRWIMDIFGMRKDEASVKLYRVLPNGSVLGLWLLYFPSYLRYKISGKNSGSVSFDEDGKEGAGKVVFARTILFDRLIQKSIEHAEQFVVMGAGYETRCYGDLQKMPLKFFELDQAKTQKLKMKCLKKAGIETSHVTFIEVDFSTEYWYEKLEAAGYDPGKKSVFLWEGVTPYLDENDVRKTLKEIKEHAASGSIVLADFYSKRMIEMLKGVKATKEAFNFGLDFSNNQEDVLKVFLESQGLSVGAFYFMGHKTNKGAFGVVTKIVI